MQVESEAIARNIVHYRSTTVPVSRVSRYKEKGEKGEVGERGERGVIVKGDVAGSVEVLVNILETRQPEGMNVRIIHSGVGPVVDSDIDMAASTRSEL